MGAGARLAAVVTVPVLLLWGVVNVLGWVVAAVYVVGALVYVSLPFLAIGAVLAGAGWLLDLGSGEASTTVSAKCDPSYLDDCLDPNASMLDSRHERRAAWWRGFTYVLGARHLFGGGVRVRRRE